MTSCLKLINNYTEISNNKYIFNNNYDTSYGLYDNSNNNNYLVKGIPKNYPLTFLSSRDISNIITFKPINAEPIIIYVSKGLDISFNNGDSSCFASVPALKLGRGVINEIFGCSKLFATLQLLQLSHAEI